MNASPPPLIDLIRETIRRRGPVSFAWFMEQALYHPANGYYSSGRCAIGRRGDYFTSVSVGPLFGRILAAQFAEMWERLDRQDNFTIVEQGAHHGDFARDLLEAAQKQMPDFFAALRYRIIEPFPILQTRQAASLDAFRDKVEWRRSLDELETFRGVHFSNELLDAMPVHLVAAEEGLWRERYVASGAEGDFHFIAGPLSSERLPDHLEKVPTPDSSYKTEVNLAALDWIEQLSRKLESGVILAVDYGYSREDFYAPERSSGTLQCYANHRFISSPLIDPGNIDITVHVDWTSLAERAEERGLRVEGFTDQHHFLTGLVSMLTPNELTPRDRRALQTLLHPGLLGRTFQFLALAKNISPGIRLSGFKFARDARSALGLSSR